MMFVSGATTDPPPDTIALVEDIVRGQVVEIITQCSALARRRGARSIAVEDVMFLIWHDVAKVNRLSNYLSWKDVRKNTRDTETAADGTDLLEEGDEPAKKAVGKKQKINLPWRLNSIFNVEPPEEEDDESDEDDDEANQAMIERLKAADERTRNMTKEEYVHWSECRQASFTYRKAKRFKDWVGVSFLTDGRLQDDIIDILGFLTFEIVANLTETALKIKNKETRVVHPGGRTTQYKKQATLFNQPDTTQTPLLPKHVREAYRRYQRPTVQNVAMRTFNRGNWRYNMKLI